MKPKIVLLCPPLAGIPEGIASGFERAGCAVSAFSYGLVKGNRFKRMFPGFAEWERTRKFNRALLGPVRRAVEKDGCDLLLVLKGARLHPRAEQFLASLQNSMALWTFDSLGRVPGQGALAGYASHAFYMDEGDVHGDHASWLPLGYDERLYRFAPGPKEFDVLFVGALGTQYRRRLAFLEALSRSPLPDRLRVGLVGSTGSRAGDRKINLHPKIMHIAPHLPPEDFAACISRSRICVNIHQDDGSKPVNPLFFAIPGTGVCQVAEDLPHLARWLEPERHFIPSSLAALPMTLETLLLEPDRTRRVAEAGRREVAERHTYARRAETILSTLGMGRTPQLDPIGNTHD